METPLAETLPYRPCVGIMVLNRDGHVWVGRRIAETDSEMAGTTKLWQMPQGGIDENEDPRTAVLREIHEETGIRSVEIIAETQGWLCYDLPAELQGKAWGGRYRGQKQKWFAARLTGDESEIDVLNPPDGHTPEFDRWTWVDLADLPRLVVPFKRDVYERLVEEFAHLAD